MKYYLITPLLFLVLTGCSKKSSNPVESTPEITFTKIFNGSNGSGSSVRQSSEGGFIIAGITFTSGTGQGDVYLIKTDVSGNEIWEKTFGGSEHDGGSSVQQISDGGFIIAGYTWSFGAGNEDVYLIKTDASGNKIWDKTFGGSSDDCGFSVQQISDGGFIIAGCTKSFGAGQGDVYLIKTDASGNEIWEKTFGGSNVEYGYSVQQTSDGGFIIVGFTWSFGAGNTDIYLIKTDVKGNKIWDKTFGGSGYEFGYSVQQTLDDGFIISGSSDSFGVGSSDVYLIKTDATGNKIWDKTFGRSGYDNGVSIRETSGNGFIVVGNTYSLDSGVTDIYLIKTDANGNKTWEKTFGAGDNNSASGYSVEQTFDGGFAITGHLSADICLIKTDSEGNVK